MVAASTAKKMSPELYSFRGPPPEIAVDKGRALVLGEPPTPGDGGSAVAADGDVDGTRLPSARSRWRCSAARVCGAR